MLMLNSPIWRRRFGASILFHFGAVLAAILAISALRAQAQAPALALPGGAPEIPTVWLVTLQGELAEGASADAMLLRRSGNLRQDLEVGLSWTGPALRGTDYTVYPEKFIFRPGADRLSIAIQARTDSLVEGDEPIVATVAAPPKPTVPGDPVSYQIGEPAVAKIILKDRLPENKPPTVAIDGPSVVNRGGSETTRFSATASDPDGKVFVVVFVLDGVRIWADANPPFSVEVGALKPGTHTLYAQATDDRNGSAVSAKVSIVIAPDPVLPEVLLTTDDGTASEADPTDIMKFTLTRSGDAKNPLRVYFKTGGTAEQNVDYLLIPSQEFQWCPLCLRPTYPPLSDFADFAAGISTMQVGARALEDSLKEGAEYLTLTLVQPPDFRDCINCPPLPPAYRINPNSGGKGVILDAPSNVLPVLTVEAVTAKTTEGDAKSPLTFRVSRLAHSIAEDLVVYFNIEGAAQYEVDYHWDGTPRTPTTFPDGRVIPAPGQELPVTIPAGHVSALVRIFALADAVTEPDESVVVRLTHRTPLPTERLAPTFEIGSPDAAKGVIIDATPVVHGLVSWLRPSKDQRFDAPADIQLEVLASIGTGLVETVEFTANGKVVGRSDFPCNVCDRFLPPGVALRHSMVWSGVAAGDYILEAVGIVGGSRIPSATLSIHVGPPPELPVITLEASGGKTSEPNPLAFVAPVSFILKRAGPANKAVKVYYSVGGTARNGRDYQFLDGDATIAAGKLTREIRLVPLADKLKEPDETVVLTVRSNRAYRVGDPRAASVVIVDVPPTVTPPPAPSIVFVEPKAAAILKQVPVISLQVTAKDPRGYFSDVEFLADGESIGVSRIFFFREPDPGTPLLHTWDWKNPAAGKHRLTARGKSSRGVAASADIAVVVEPGHQPPPPLAHPADEASADFVLTSEEVADYTTAWKKGSKWIAPPNPVPIGYVTRAGYLLRSGGAYRYDPTIGTPGLFWVPAVPVAAEADFAGVRAALTSSDDLAAANLVADLPVRSPVNSALAEIAAGPEPGKFKLTVYVTLAPGTKAWAVEENVGTGAVVSDVSEGGYFDAVAGVLRWGPFFDALDRALTARVGRDFPLRMTGTASFDGADFKLPHQLGPQSLPVAAGGGAGPRIASVRTLDNGAVQLLLVDESAGSCDLEVSSDLVNWEKVGRMDSGQNCSSILDTDAEEARVRFYRVERY